MKFYVATAFRNKEEASSLMRGLEKLGHSITYDWTVHEKDVSTIEDETERNKLGVEAALTDFAGVAACDVLVIIDHPKCVSAHTELGIALGLNKEVVEIGNSEPEYRNLFYRLPQVAKAPSVEAVLEMYS